MAQELGLIAVLITTSASAGIGLISQIQHSRCSSLKINWWGCECVRSVPDIIEPTVELQPNNLTN